MRKSSLVICMYGYICIGGNKNLFFYLCFKLCLALRYLHKEKRIVHRDLTPNNIMLGDKDKVTVSKYESLNFFQLNNFFFFLNPYSRVVSSRTLNVQGKILLLGFRVR